MLISISSFKQKEKYYDECKRILHNSYENIHKIETNTLMKDDHPWIVWVNGSLLKAVIVFKYSHGFKAILSGSEKSLSARKSLMSIIREELWKPGNWSEVSHGYEDFAVKNNINLIRNNYCKELLDGKEISKYDNDGYHYNRMIYGQDLRKVMAGNPIFPGTMANHLIVGDA